MSHRLPLPLGPADQQAGYWWELSMARNGLINRRLHANTYDLTPDGLELGTGPATYLHSAPALVCPTRCRYAPSVAPASPCPLPRGMGDARPSGNLWDLGSVCPGGVRRRRAPAAREGHRE